MTDTIPPGAPTPLLATARLQFHAGFTLDNAVPLVPYLKRLGVTRLYASPILKARPGSAACRLAVLPVEDVLGLPERPNLPGTVEGHPNWRRRLPGDAGSLLDDPRVSRRLQAVARARPRGDG